MREKGYNPGPEDGSWHERTSKAIQQFLIDSRYDCGRDGADGIFGVVSTTACQRFLNDHDCRCDVDGNWGVETTCAFQQWLQSEDIKAFNPDISSDDWINGFHQTSPDVAKEINKGNQGSKMRPGSRGALGPGIYFAHTEEDTNGKALSKGVVFLCRIATGRVKVLEHWDPSWTEQKMKDSGYDTLMILGNRTADANRPEYKIYDPERIAIVSWWNVKT